MSHLQRQRKVRVATVLVGAAVMLVVTGRAHADLPTLPVPPPPPSASQVLASELAHALYQGSTPPKGAAFSLLIAAGQLPSKVNADTLVAYLTDTLEAALRARTSLGPNVPLGAPRSVDEAITVELGIAEGHLTATATRRAMPSNVWERLRSPGGAVVATGFSTVRIDLELRTLLGLGRRDVRLDRLRVVPVGDKSLAIRRDEPILDMAIADFDGDRVPELATLQPSAVRLVGWAAGGFTRDAGVAALEVVPRNPARVRRPVGRLIVGTQTNGALQLVAATSDHAGPVLIRAPGGALSLTLDTQAGPQWPLYSLGPDTWVGTGWPQGVDVLDGSLWETHTPAADAGADAQVGATQAFYDLRAFSVRRATSPTWSPYLGTVDIEGTLHVWTPGQDVVATRRNTGATWMIADLDGDGDAEVLTTSTVTSGPDKLTLSSIGPEGRFRTLWTGSVPNPVTAITCGDVDRDGYREFIIATWDQAAQRSELTVVVPRS